MGGTDQGTEEDSHDNRDGDQLRQAHWTRILVAIWVREHPNRLWITGSGEHWVEILDSESLSSRWSP
jgi:hypothetical protein